MMQAQLEFFPQALQLAQAASDAQLADIVHRYHTFMHEGSPEVAPSAEIDMIWRVHKLSPAAYASVRMLSRLFGLAIVVLFVLVFDYYGHDSDGRATACVGQYHKRIEEGSDYCPSDEWVASLVAAVRRQTSFVTKILEEQSLGRASEDTIRTELNNYKAFLAEAGKSEQELPVPSLLLDLVWHTHMLYPTRYANECVRIAGRFIDHDDDPIEHGDEVGGTRNA